MSYWNKLAALAVAGVVFAVPALADGRDRVVVQGPAPLQAQTICEHGQTTDGKCYTPRAHTQTRIVRHAPTTTTQRVVRSSAQTHRVSSAQYDFSGFTGGVGTDIGTGFVAGGGRGVVVIQSGTRRFSGVPGRAFAIARARGGCCH